MSRSRRRRRSRGRATASPRRALYAFVLLAAVPVGLLVPTLLSFGDDCPPSRDSGLPPCSNSLRTAKPPPAGPPPEPLTVIPSGVEETELVRISAPGEDGEAAPLHQYSRRQAWNADETLLLLSDRIIDARTFETFRPALEVSSESDWSNTDPDLLYGVRYNPDPNELVVWNVRGDRVETIERFERFSECRFGDGEGSLSEDDRYVVLSCRGEGSDATTLIAYDLVERRVIGELAASPDFNWASFSRSGRYIVVENSRLGVERRELWRYEPDLTEPLLLGTDPQHGDLGVDVEGKDVFVMIGQRRLDFIRLEDGLRARVPLAGSSEEVGFGHVSCRARRRPGWCYVSTWEGGLLGAVLIGLDRDGTRRYEPVARVARVGLAAFELWGFHHSSLADYAAQPKASVSPSGRQMVFSSDWGGQSPTSDYVLRLDAPKAAAASPAGD